MTLHPTVEAFIETVVDSPLKLQILQRFYEQPQLVVSARSLAAQMFCDLWSADAALCELAADGVLAAACDGSAPHFRYAPRPAQTAPIQRLFETYDDPIRRDSLQSLLREVSDYAPYRRAARQQRPALRPWMQELAH